MYVASIHLESCFYQCCILGILWGPSLDYMQKACTKVNSTLTRPHGLVYTVEVKKKLGTRHDEDSFLSVEL